MYFEKEHTLGNNTLANTTFFSITVYIHYYSILVSDVQQSD